MWTQYFIYFTVRNNLFTLYQTLPRGETLAAHWREKGEHFNGKNVGKDFELAVEVDADFPPYVYLQRYGWDAEPISLVATPPRRIPFSIIIGGIGKDINSLQVKNVVSKMKRLGTAFQNYHVLIYENNSSHESRKAWQESEGQISRQSSHLRHSVR